MRLRDALLRQVGAYDGGNFSAMRTEQQAIGGAAGAPAGWSSFAYSEKYPFKIERESLIGMYYMGFWTGTWSTTGIGIYTHVGIDDQPIATPVATAAPAFSGSANVGSTGAIVGSVFGTLQLLSASGAANGGTPLGIGDLARQPVAFLSGPTTYSQYRVAPGDHVLDVRFYRNTSVASAITLRDRMLWFFVTEFPSGGGG